MPGTLCSILQVRDDGAFPLPVLQSGAQEQRKDTWSPFGLCSCRHPPPPEPWLTQVTAYTAPQGLAERVQTTQLTALPREVPMSHPCCPGGQGYGYQCHWPLPLCGRPHSGLTPKIQSGASTPISSSLPCSPPGHRAPQSSSQGSCDTSVTLPQEQAPPGLLGHHICLVPSSISSHSFPVSFVGSP